MQGPASCTCLGALKICLLWQTWSYQQVILTHQAQPHVLFMGSAQRQYFLSGKKRATRTQKCHKRYSKAWENIFFCTIIATKKMSICFIFWSWDTLKELRIHRLDVHSVFHHKKHTMQTNVITYHTSTREMWTKEKAS